ncbi:MAG: hypothetical protein FRX49_01209 [Trebouxia sp. A1-2]|nr:MAG: hypothetical protein FRX49_01209 [Trebouxia sp. A1-2]
MTDREHLQEWRDKTQTGSLHPQYDSLHAIMLHAPPNLDASSLTQLYSSLCAPPINSSNTPQLTQQAVADLIHDSRRRGYSSTRQLVKHQTFSEFEQLGRNGDWDSANQTGKPMLSAQVRSMLQGYGNHATQRGYPKTAAVPLTEAEMQLLLQSMHQACNSSSTDPHQ